MRKNIKSILKRKIKELLLFLRLPFLKIFYRKPHVIISFGISIGDDLLCTIIAEQLNKQGYKRVWMLTCFPGLFFNNPHIQKVIKKDKNGNTSILMRTYLKSIKANIIYPLYTSYNKITDQDVIPKKHIVHLMCDVAKARYPYTIKPSIYLTEDEKLKGKLYDNQICIHSTGIGAKQHMRNKDWYLERFEEVVN